jgi:glycosyltransferase involved in cell wall biosynthesis
LSPTYSVVVPAYNAAATVGATIRSILAQSVTDLELIVVDDGSMDTTASIVEAAGDRRIRLIRQSNTGLAGARNRGIAEARGRYVAFLDADDLWMPEYLAVVSETFDGDPSTGVVYSDGWVLAHATGRIRRTSVLAYGKPPPPTVSDPNELFRRLLAYNYLISAAVVRKSVLEDVGGFRTELRRAEDWELWLRISANGYRLVCAPGRLVVRREIAGSLSADGVAMLDSAVRVIDIVLDEYLLTDELRIAAVATRDRLLRLRSTSGEQGGRASIEQRALALARRVKRPLDRRFLWLAEAPVDVAALLRSVNDSAGRS